MRVAVIGMGSMGTHHARIYKELGVLSAICDTDKEQLRLKEEVYQVATYTNFSELLEMKPTAVSIATPTPTHLEIAVKCMEAGVHILLEKPLSDNIKSAQQIVSIAEKSKKILAVGYVERFNPAFLALQKLVIEKSFGEIVSINIKRIGGKPRSADNIILDVMTHDFSLLASLLNSQPRTIWTCKNESNGIINTAQVLLDYGKTSVSCEANWVSPFKVRRIEVTGTDLYCEVDLINQQVTKFPSSPIGFSQEPLRGELVAFLDAVETGDVRNIVTGREGFSVLKTTLQVSKGEYK